MKSLKFLIESGMERASLVLAAQSITDKLQNMAETLAKIEASDVMPMMDSMKENFGVEVAQRFEGTVTNKLRDLTEALRSARDEIGNEIIRMEASVNGEPVSDMAMDDNTAPDDIGDNDMARDAGEDTEGDPAADEFEMPPADLENGEEGAPEDAGDATTDEFDDLFRDAGNAAGRVRKESVERSGPASLRESSNPDAMVRARFARTLRSSKGNVQKAAALVAEHFEIDLDDVVNILIEGRKVK